MTGMYGIAKSRSGTVRGAWQVDARRTWPVFLYETVVNGKTSACMFDYGLDPAGVLNNIALLGLDPGKASAFGLSHGHVTTMLAAVSILRQNQSRIAGGTPFYVARRHLPADTRSVPDVQNPTISDSLIKRTSKLSD